MIVYLDNSGTTKPYNEVVERMDNIQRELWGNPSSAHRLGLDAEKALKSSVSLLAHELNIKKENIVFTSGGTESNNMALRQPYFNLSKIKNSEIITSAIEHPSVDETCNYLSSQGVKVTKLPVDITGLIDVSKLGTLITGNTSIVSIMLVNNEVGTIQPIKEIGQIIKKEIFDQGLDEILFHTDAVQALGKMPIDMCSPEFMDVDLLSISGHKIHGPKGIGALFTRKPEKLKPFIMGGGQQRGFRSGTEYVAGIVGFGEASKINCRNMNDKLEKIGKLRNRLLKGLKDSINHIHVNSPEEISIVGEVGKCVPHILSISFLGTKGEVILHSLEEKSIFVSTESACSSKKRSVSHVLKAMGLNDNEIEGTIRYSLSQFNTEDEIDYTIEETKKAVEKMRKLTGFKY